MTCCVTFGILYFCCVLSVCVWFLCITYDYCCTLFNCRSISWLFRTSILAVQCWQTIAVRIIYTFLGFCRVLALLSMVIAVPWRLSIALWHNCKNWCRGSQDSHQMIVQKLSFWWFNNVAEIQGHSHWQQFYTSVLISSVYKRIFLLLWSSGSCSTIAARWHHHILLLCCDCRY